MIIVRVAGKVFQFVVRQAFRQRNHRSLAHGLRRLADTLGNPSARAAIGSCGVDCYVDSPVRGHMKRQLFRRLGAS